MCKLRVCQHLVNDHTRITAPDFVLLCGPWRCIRPPLFVVLQLKVVPRRVKNINGVGVTQALNIFFHAPASMYVPPSAKSHSGKPGMF